MWVVYEVANGEIVKTVSGQIEGQLEAGQAAVMGEGSWLTHHVVNGTLVELSKRRTPPTKYHKWDRASSSWIDPRSSAQVEEDAWKEVRAKRDALLAASDWMALRAIESGIPLESTWSTRRQAWRDVTEAATPDDVIWPE